MSNPQIKNLSQLEEQNFLTIGALFRTQGLHQWDEKVMKDIRDHPEKWVGAQGICLIDQFEILSAILIRDCIEFTEILAIATHPKFIHQGYATTLLKELISYNNYPYLLEVSSQNTAAIHLYKKNGFIEISMRKNYYRLADGTLQDALILRLEQNNKI